MAGRARYTSLRAWIFSNTRASAPRLFRPLWRHRHTPPGTHEEKLHEDEKIHQDNRDIRHDNRDIRHDRADIGKDKAALADERTERNTAQRRENRDLANGNVKGAEYWSKQRAQDQHQVNADRRELHQDRKDLHADVKDRNHDVHARNHEVHKRDRDASKI